jgi:hypothetical protein
MPDAARRWRRLKRRTQRQRRSPPLALRMLWVRVRTQALPWVVLPRVRRPLRVLPWMVLQRRRQLLLSRAIHRCVRVVLLRPLRRSSTSAAAKECSHCLCSHMHGSRAGR